MKIARLLPAGLVVITLVAGPAILAEAWSLNPFASSSEDTKLKNPSAPAATKQPSLLSRVGRATKGAISRVGNAVIPKTTSKSPPPSQFDLGSHVAPKPVSTNPEEPSSAVGSWLRKQPPTQKPLTTSEWMTQKRVQP
jgi:hypothetical protein